MKEAKTTGGYFFSHLVISAAHQDVRHRLVLLFLLDVSHRGSCPDGGVFGGQGFKMKGQRRGGLIHTAEIEVSEFRFLLGTALLGCEGDGFAQAGFVIQREGICLAESACILLHLGGTFERRCGRHLPFAVSFDFFAVEVEDEAIFSIKGGHEVLLLAWRDDLAF